MALVGLPAVSGLSVEQRKRLTIAVELVSNPAIVFMDEPTSGACKHLQNLGCRQVAILPPLVHEPVQIGLLVLLLCERLCVSTSHPCWCAPSGTCGQTMHVLKLARPAAPDITSSAAVSHFAALSDSRKRWVCTKGVAMRVSALCHYCYRAGRAGGGHRHAGGAQHRQHRAHDRVHHPPAGDRHLRGAWSACIAVDSSRTACPTPISGCGLIAHPLA